MAAATEVAAFRIIAESVTNTLRHAGARHCRVGLSVDEAVGVLLVTVTDDGHGLATDFRRGVGLSSMQERASELGGHFALTSDADGTTVTARLPLKVPS